LPSPLLDEPQNQPIVVLNAKILIFEVVDALRKIGEELRLSLAQSLTFWRILTNRIPKEITQASTRPSSASTMVHGIEDLKCADAHIAKIIASISFNCKLV
jgi:hypothetical protein